MSTEIYALRPMERAFAVLDDGACMIKRFSVCPGASMDYDLVCEIYDKSNTREVVSRFALAESDSRLDLVNRCKDFINSHEADGWGLTKASKCLFMPSFSPSAESLSIWDAVTGRGWLESGFSRVACAG